MKLLLVADDGEILDSTNAFTVSEWNRARLEPLAGMSLLGELPTAHEPAPVDPLEGRSSKSATA